MTFMSDDHSQGFSEKPVHDGMEEREIHLSLPTPTYPSPWEETDGKGSELD